MSRWDVAIKLLVDLAVLIAAGAWGWTSDTAPVANDAGSGYANVTVTILAGFWSASLAALFVGIMTSMNPRRAAVTGLIYTALQGYCLGAISAAFEAQTEGIVGAAILSTVGVVAAAWFLYVTGLIKPTPRMAFGVAAAIGGSRSNALDTIIGRLRPGSRIGRDPSPSVSGTHVAPTERIPHPADHPRTTTLVPTGAQCQRYTASGVD